MSLARRDVTEAEMRLGYDRRACPDCGGQFWWPFIRCIQKTPRERDIGTDDGVVEFVRECPREGMGPA